MSYPRHIALPFCGLTLLAWSLAACGGTFTGSDGSSGAGSSAGGPGSAGSPGSAGRGGSDPGSCVHGDMTYPDGASLPSGDNCNSCFCDNGQVGCTLVGCVGGCFYEGTLYQRGQSFPASDGCNTCSCLADGVFACTEIGCNGCQNAASAYAAAIQEAKVCDPQQPNQCSKLVTEGLACGCGTMVNPANGKAIEVAQAAQEQYSVLACGEDVLCGACPPPSSSYCSPEGRCETIQHNGNGAACKVNGVVYESGTSGIPDPASCNKCQCSDGELICTEIGCPAECPPNRVFSTQCAQCGPTDACEIVEYACLPVCTDTCATGACIGGLCKSLCG